MLVVRHNNWLSFVLFLLFSLVLMSFLLALFLRVVVVSFIVFYVVVIGVDVVCCVKY